MERIRNRKRKREWGRVRRSQEVNEEEMEGKRGEGREGMREGSVGGCKQGIKRRTDIYIAYYKYDTV